MRSITGIRAIRAIRALTWLLVLLLMSPTGLGAQQPESGQGTDAAQSYTYTQEQLDRLLAPIALYPDTLLSQILMASTYPLEVVEADRWLKQNQNLTGDRLDESLKDKPWDVSVKSLCHFPQVLSMMDEKLQETMDMGNAFLGQQDQVMDTIQKLRAQAQAQGNLKSTENQRVVVQDRDIVIEPANPDVVYVPAYDPCWAYGPWWYPTCYPLWFWYPGLVVGAGFFWGPGIFIGPIDFWCGFSWHRHSIFVNVNKTIFINKVGATRMHGGIETWMHNPVHRRGVAYHDTATARRFGRTGLPGVEPRRAFRGFGAEGRSPVQGRAGGIEHPGVQPSQRPSESVTGGRGVERPRGGGAFQDFGRGGIKSQQHSERGRQSMGIGPRDGGLPGGERLHPGEGGGGAARSGGFGGGSHTGGDGDRHNR
ncbi:MAG: DUF3300 domain-containing protein [Syntrophaceae bacterium]